MNYAAKLYKEGGMTVNQICEITNVWYCGIKRRQSAHAHQVYGWNDPKCNSKIMGFTPGKIASTVDKILDINRQTTYLIRPSFITYDRKNWKNVANNTIEFYLDFETFNSNFGSIIKDGIISYNNNHGKFFNVYLDNFKPFKNYYSYIPFRRDSKLLKLEHDDCGFNDGRWRDDNSRWNQLRYNNEVQFGYRDDIEDGLSTCIDYTMYSKTKDNKITHLNIGI